MFGRKSKTEKRLYHQIIKSFDTLKPQEHNVKGLILLLKNIQQVGIENGNKYDGLLSGLINGVTGSNVLGIVSALKAKKDARLISLLREVKDIETNQALNDLVDALEKALSADTTATASHAGKVFTYEAMQDASTSSSSSAAAAAAGPDASSVVGDVVPAGQYARRGDLAGMQSYATSATAVTSGTAASTKAAYGMVPGSPELQAAHDAKRAAANRAATTSTYAMTSSFASPKPYGAVPGDNAALAAFRANTQRDNKAVYQTPNDERDDAGDSLSSVPSYTSATPIGVENGYSFMPSTDSQPKATGGAPSALFSPRATAAVAKSQTAGATQYGSIPTGDNSSGYGVLPGSGDDSDREADNKPQYQAPKY